MGTGDPAVDPHRQRRVGLFSSSKHHRDRSKTDVRCDICHGDACRSSPRSDAPDEILIQACECGPVHRSCLIRWIAERPRNSVDRCNTCGVLYLDSHELAEYRSDLGWDLACSAAILLASTYFLGTIYYAKDIFVSATVITTGDRMWVGAVLLGALSVVATCLWGLKAAWERCCQPEHRGSGSGRSSQRRRNYHHNCSCHHNNDWMFWWWMTRDSSIHHHHYDSSSTTPTSPAPKSTTTSSKKDNEDNAALQGACALFLVLFLVAVMAVGVVWLIRRARARILFKYLAPSID